MSRGAVTRGKCTEVLRRMWELPPLEGLKEADAAYAAGFFDGEGCLLIQEGFSGLSFSISAANTDFSVLEWLAQTFAPGRGGISRHDYSASARQDCGQWGIYGYAAVRFVRVILPYLRVKREKADHWLKTWDERADLRKREANLELWREKFKRRAPI